MFLKDKYKKKNVKRKGTSKRSQEEKENDESFSRSGKEWSLSF